MHMEWQMMVCQRQAAKWRCVNEGEVCESLEKGLKEWAAGDIERIENRRESLRLLLSTCKKKFMSFSLNIIQ